MGSILIAWLLIGATFSLGFIAENRLWFILKKQHGWNLVMLVTLLWPLEIIAESHRWNHG